MYWGIMITCHVTLVMKGDDSTPTREFIPTYVYIIQCVPLCIIKLCPIYIYIYICIYNNYIRSAAV